MQVAVMARAHGSHAAPYRRNEFSRKYLPVNGHSSRDAASILN
jgi:hypothetical protein